MKIAPTNTNDTLQTSNVRRVEQQQKNYKSFIYLYMTFCQLYGIRLREVIT